MAAWAASNWVSPGRCRGSVTNVRATCQRRRRKGFELVEGDAARTENESRHPLGGGSQTAKSTWYANQLHCHPSTPFYSSKIARVWLY